MRAMPRTQDAHEVRHKCKAEGCKTHRQIIQFVAGQNQTLQLWYGLCRNNPILFVKSDEGPHGLHKL